MDDMFLNKSLFLIRLRFFLLTLILKQFLFLTFSFSFVVFIPLQMVLYVFF